MMVVDDRKAWTAPQSMISWRPVSSVPDLDLDQVHVWWVSLDIDDGRREHLRQVLSTAECERAARFKFERNRNDYIAGRGTLRTLCAAYTNARARDIKFVLGPVGKPGLRTGVDGNRLCFNQTDAAGHALYAFCWNNEVGVDLEHLEREVAWERIARRKFTAREAQALLSLPAAERKAAFLACWTRKEGYGKAKGVGIHYPLDSVETCLDCRDPRLLIEDNDATQWILEQIYPNENYVGSLVYTPGMKPTDFLALQPEILSAQDSLDQV